MSAIISTKKIGRIIFFQLILLMVLPARELTLDAIFKEEQFKRASLGSFKWVPEINSYVFFSDDSITGGKSLFQVNLLTGDTTRFVSSENFIIHEDTLHITGFWFSPNGDNLLILTQERKQWRHSFFGVYYNYSISQDLLTPIAKGEHLRNIKYAPDSRKIAYVKEDNNLYIFDILQHKEKRLTRDGSETILNGYRGWLYEEEFGSFDGYRWSPDSKNILFFREDQSHVKQFTYLDEKGLYPEVKQVYYPKAGEENPMVKTGVISVRGGRTSWLNFEEYEDIYFPKAGWFEDEAVVARLNRKQNHLEWIKFNSKYRQRMLIIEDIDSAWVDVHENPLFLTDGSFLFTSERSGYRHIFYAESDGSIISQVTEGEWEVKRLVDVDEELGKIYFTANRESILEQHFYSVNPDGSGLLQLTSGPGWHSPQLSPTKAYFIDSYSSSKTPRKILLKTIQGETIRVMQETDMEPYLEYEFTYPEFFDFATADGVTLKGMITLPWNFDEEKKYPIIINGYGLAGSQMAADRWGGRNYLWHQYMAQNGHIIVSINNRQTGGRGKAFKNLGYRDLGKWLINDHIEAVNYLGKFPYADTSRVGVWGWSGGGYFTALALTKGADYFTTGVSVAPVTDWRLYDTAYTERYMGLLSENEAGYDTASVLTYVDQFKGKLLLVHGTGDDNVHAQNSLWLMDKFIESGKQVDMLFYPSRSHGIYGGNATYHLYSRMAEYFFENL